MWTRTGTWRSGGGMSWRLNGGPIARPRCRRPAACSRCCATAAELRGRFRDLAYCYLACKTQSLALRVEDKKIKIAVDQSWLNIKGVVRDLENMNDSLVPR